MSLSPNLLSFFFPCLPHTQICVVSGAFCLGLELVFFPSEDSTGVCWKHLVASDVSLWYARQLILSEFSWNKPHLNCSMHPKSLVTGWLYSFLKSSDTVSVPKSAPLDGILKTFSQTYIPIMVSIFFLGAILNTDPFLDSGVLSHLQEPVPQAFPVVFRQHQVLRQVLTQQVTDALSLFLTRLYFRTHFFLY